MKCVERIGERDRNVEVRAPSLERDVFVIMPFSATRTSTEEDWTETYRHIFVPAIEAAGYTCHRAQVSTGSLITSIVGDLRTARIVLADITDQNANVFYELGVRHALSRRTIIVSQRVEDIPSDLRGYWTIVYGRRPQEVAEFRDELGRIIAAIEKDPDRIDSPVGELLERDNANVLATIQRENAKKLTAFLTEISGNLNVLRVLPHCDLGQLSVSCLDLLLQTLHVDLGPESLRLAHEAVYSLRRIIKTDGNVPRERVSKAIEDLERVGEAVGDARDRLIKGQFNEPPTISTLVWVSGPGRFEHEQQSFCNYSTPISSASAVDRMPLPSDRDGNAP